MDIRVTIVNPSNAPIPLKYIDLFSGIGGFHQAFNQLNELGYETECVLSCDKDKHCRSIYQENYGIEVHPDIKKLKPEDIPDYDILCAGFPCQPFSNAGKKTTFKHHKGTLFDEIMRLIKDKKPKFLFLENVKHIMKVSNGEVFKYVMAKLDEFGYNVQLFKMSPHEYGIPQQRERIYFVCVHKSIDKKEVELVEPKTSEIILENLLQNKEEVGTKYFVSGDVKTALEAWEEMIKEFEVGEKISPTIMANEFHKVYTPVEFTALAAWRQENKKKNKPLYNKYKVKWDEWYERNTTILKRREIYAKSEWQVGKVKDNDSIFDYFIQLRQSGIRVKKKKYFPTLVAMSQIPVYGKEMRYITPRECARIQSFPESFIIHNDDRQSYKQFGNSVNVDNVRNVVKSTLHTYHDSL